MDTTDDYRMPGGRRVCDTFNGARIGAIAGTALGAVITALTPPAVTGSIPVGSGLVGTGGYLSERHRIRSELDRGQPDE